MGMKIASFDKGKEEKTNEWDVLANECRNEMVNDRDMKGNLFI